jgi:hypothetical protein
MVAFTSIVKLSLAYSDCLGSVGGNQAPPIRYNYSRMETVVWASLCIVCSLEVTENYFVFNLIGIYGE